MKVLQLIYESRDSPFGFGGAGVRAYEIYRRLADRHRIDLVCMRYPGAVDGERDGLRHVFAGVESASLTRSVAAYTARASAYVHRFGDRYDVIVENFLPSTPFFARFRTRTPVVLQVQGVMRRHALRKFAPHYGLPLYVMERVYPRLYDRFLFVSDVTRALVLDGRRGRVECCDVVPNGVARELITEPGADGDYILFFSRVDIYTKGLDLLMAAFASVARRFPGVSLKLAGFAADPVASLLAMVPADVRPRVEYLGFVDGPAKRTLLAKAKLVVLPSRHESAPISVLEAAACGRPLIVSDIAELVDVPRRGLGLAFSSGSADGLRQSMEILLTNETLRKTMGAAGRAWSARHLWDDIAVAFENALDKATRARA